MEAADLPADLDLLLEAANDFASYPGAGQIPRNFILSSYQYLTKLIYLFLFLGLQTDASAKEFLDRFPLPLLFRYSFSPSPAANSNFTYYMLESNLILLI